MVGHDAPNMLRGERQMRADAVKATELAIASLKQALLLIDLLREIYGLEDEQPEQA